MAELQPLDLTREEYIEQCVPLYKAAIEGDWKSANDILDKNSRLVRYRITENKETLLHIAAMAQSAKFVENLMKKMNPKDLEYKNVEGNTAFCLAAITGNVKIAEVMVKKNSELLTMRGAQDMMPLHLAALYVKHDMVTYLYKESAIMPGDWTVDERNEVLLKCIEVDFFDVALNILNKNEDLPQGNYVWKVLQVLARKPYAFDDMEPHIIWKTINSIFESIHLKEPAIMKYEATQILRIVWNKIVIKPNDEIDEILKGPMIDNNGMPTHPSRILFVAAKMGNTRFLVEMIRKYPDLIWKKNDDGQTIFHVAVSHRRESVYSLLYEIGPMKDLITPIADINGNNMLHLVGIYSAEKNPYEGVLTAPFQMQRELSWFKEVKAMIPSSYWEAKNEAGRTPSELFNENHKDLVAKSKKWMKGTTNQCMVAAVLMATIGFTVVYSIPGGYDQSSGFPMLLHDRHFVAFVVLDAISFIFSSLSIIMFLSIVVSRYAQTDFLESLPQKLTTGLATLFLSIITMMAAFGVSFFILYYHELMLVPLIIGALAAVIAIPYTKELYPLFVDAFHLRYGSSYLFKPKRHMLYNNPRF